MKDELHANPAMGHKKKQSKPEGRSHAYNWRNRNGFKKIRGDF